MAAPVKTIYQKLVDIQARIKAPKGQTNSFGGYKFRSCEDIQSAAKPLLHEHGLLVLLTDAVRTIGDRHYIGARCVLTDGTDEIVTHAYAREPLTKKGFDESQITGASSSYARKYALQGMFALDDGKDADGEQPVDKGNETVDATQMELIKVLIAQTSTDSEKLLEHYGAGRVGQLTVAQGEAAIKTLTAKKAKMQREAAK